MKGYAAYLIVSSVDSHCLMLFDLRYGKVPEPGMTGLRPFLDCGNLLS
jgi:hypothetical protein